jgi:hypothetical protein
MSRNETWRTRKYWESVGGLLIEEFCAIHGCLDGTIGKRLIDGIIVLGEEKARQTGGSFNFKDKDIIIIQTKSKRLGMTLMGQAYFSREIMKKFEPRSIRTVTLCGKGDIELEKLCKEADIEVVVITESEDSKNRK